MFLQNENVGSIISETLFFIKPLKKLSCPAYIYALYLSRRDIFFTTNILYGKTHINLTFHALSLRHSNTVLSRHYIAKNIWRNMTLFPLCRKRRATDLLPLEYGIFTPDERMACCKFLKQREIKERPFLRAEWSQRETHASHLF